MHQAPGTRFDDVRLELPRRQWLQPNSLGLLHRCDFSGCLGMSASDVSAGECRVGKHHSQRILLTTPRFIHEFNVEDPPPRLASPQVASSPWCLSLVAFFGHHPDLDSSSPTSGISSTSGSWNDTVPVPTDQQIIGDIDMLADLLPLPTRPSGTHSAMVDSLCFSHFTPPDFIQHLNLLPPTARKTTTKKRTERGKKKRANSASWCWSGWHSARHGGSRRGAKKRPIQPRGAGRFGAWRGMVMMCFDIRMQQRTPRGDIETVYTQNSIVLLPIKPVLPVGTFYLVQGTLILLRNLHALLNTIGLLSFFT